MNDHLKSSGENKQDKRHVEESRRLADEEKRKKTYLAREEAIEKLSRLKESERASKRAKEESEQSAKTEARKKIYLEGEQKIADAEKERKLRERQTK
jgi:hypothetical protein